MESKGSLIGNKVILNKDVASRNMISDAFSESKSYAVGDTCIYENKLYKCKTATSGTWDATKWDETTVGAYASELKGTLTNMFTKVTKTIDCTSYLANPASYNGAYVYTNDADFSGARYIIPLGARKSGSGYLVTVAVDSQAIRLCCIASQTDVVVDLLVVR